MKCMACNSETSLDYGYGGETLCYECAIKSDAGHPHKNATINTSNNDASQYNYFEINHPKSDNYRPDLYSRESTPNFLSTRLWISFFAFIIYTHYANSFIVSILVPVFVWLITGIIVIWSHHYFSSKIQQSRDKLAHEIFEKLQKDEECGSFYLYLRSFESTGQLALKQPTQFIPSHISDNPEIPISDLSKDMDTEFETIFSNSIWGETPFIALGEPGEHVGAGRMPTSESDWNELIVKAINRTKGIIIVPSITQGTLWEIQHIIRNRLLHKTIFVMLPHEDGTKTHLFTVLKNHGLVIDHKQFFYKYYNKPDNYQHVNQQVANEPIPYLCKFDQSGNLRTIVTFYKSGMRLLIENILCGPSKDIIGTELSQRAVNALIEH